VQRLDRLHTYTYVERERERATYIYIYIYVCVWLVVPFTPMWDNVLGVVIELRSEQLSEIAILIACFS